MAMSWFSYTITLDLVGYFLLQSSYLCEDDVHADCERRASRGCCHGACGDGEPYLEARRTLSECRASCREYYRGWHPGDLPEMIKLYGGLEVL